VGVFALIDFFEDRAQFFQRYRAAEQVTLNKVTARTLEEFVLLQAFHAFGDHLQMQGVGHDDLHVLDERSIFRVFSGRRLRQSG